MTQIHTHEPGEQDSAYDGLLVNDARWAFGSDFDDPLAGVDTAVPDGVEAEVLAAYCLMLGDDALVLAQRLCEWCGHAPDLEEDVALANIALDLLGQARVLLARAAAADPTVVPRLPAGSPVPAEDALAFFRDEAQFRNLRVVEAPNGDFAETIARLVLFSTYRLALLERLTSSRDAVLAAVAAKGVKEVAYHRDFAAHWFVVLAQGTPNSRCRLEAGLDALWPHWQEAFATHPVEAAAAAAGVGVAPASLREQVKAVLTAIFSAGQMQLGTPATMPGPGGRDGRHTEALGRLLAEMQVVARAHPMGAW